MVKLHERDNYYLYLDESGDFSEVKDDNKKKAL